MNGSRYQLERTPNIMSTQEPIYPTASPEWGDQRRKLAPKPAEAFKAFSRSVYAEGAIPAKMKQLIAVAAAHVTQSPYCILSNTRAALRSGATPEEVMEAIWVATEMCAGAAYAHSGLALDMISLARNEEPALPGAR